MIPSILWSPPVSPAAKHPITWCCHPRTSQLWRCSQVFRLPSFSSKCNDGNYGQTVSSHCRTLLQKLRSLSLCALANCSLAFYVALWEMSSSWLSGLSVHVQAIHSSLPDILADFFWFFHDATQGSRVFEVCRKIHFQVDLPLIQMLSINQSETSKAMTSSSGLSQSL